MASLNSLQMRALAAQTTSLRVAEDGPVALRIKHVAANAVTSVVVTSATNIVLTDADGASTFTFATYSTLGKLADAINGTANWDCKILDGLRATLTIASNLIGGTITASAKLDEMVYDIMLDTTTTFTFPIRATYDRSVGAGIPVVGHRVKVVSFEYVMDVGTAAADKVRIYECDPVTRTDLQIWSAPSVDSTSTVTSFDFSKAPLTAKEGNDLVVMVTDAASITDAATNYLQVVYTRE
jgi:hypothetical protein